jgi:hypothetical protein
MIDSCRSPKADSFQRRPCPLFQLNNRLTNRRKQMPEMTIIRLLDLHPENVPPNFPSFNRRVF